MKCGRHYGWCWLSTQQTLASHWSLWRLSYYLLTYLYMFMHVHTLLPDVEVKGQVTEVLSCHHMGSGAQIQILRPGRKHLYPLSLLTVPGLPWLCQLRWSLTGCSQHHFGIQDYTNGGGHWRAASIQHYLLPDNYAVWLDASSSCSLTSQPWWTMPWKCQGRLFLPYIALDRVSSKLRQ